MARINTKIVDVGEMRLDQYLAKSQICTSRNEAQRLIADERIRIDLRIETRPSQKVILGQQIDIDWPPIKPTELTPKKIDFEIFFEDEHVLVINKPARLVVHPGAGNYDESLVHGLLHHCEGLSQIGGVERPGIVHRLDKGTSGVMIVAKNDRAHQNLSEQFQNHTIYKEYMALCSLRLRIQEQTLDNLVKRSETNRKKFVVNQKKGKRAVSHIHLVKATDKASLVRVIIETGRTHQVRVHMNFLGHPILGDDLYGGTKKLNLLDETQKTFIKEIGRPLLHAALIEFNHPVTKERHRYRASFDDDFKKALKLFNLED